MTWTQGKARSSRRGVAAIWLLVVLSVLTVVMGVVTSQVLACRRWQDHCRDQQQAVWLARAGVERAAARLLEDSAGYPGESVELIPKSKLQITVKTLPGSTDTFVVTSQAQYPTEGRAVVRSLTRHFKRVTEKGTVRLEVVDADRPDHENGPPTPEKK